MTANVYDLTTRRPLVVAEPDGEDPNDLAPRTDREQALYWAGYRAGSDARAEFEQRQWDALLAKAEEICGRQGAQPVQHLNPVS